MSERTVYVADAHAHRPWWTKHELAHFHRIESALRAAGLRVEMDSGVTDEGEPWFVFFDVESGDVVAHFARISRTYVACAPFLNSALTRRVFSDLVARFLDRCPGPGRRMTTYSSRSTPAA